MVLKILIKIFKNIILLRIREYNKFLSNFIIDAIAIKDKIEVFIFLVYI